MYLSISVFISSAKLSFFSSSSAQSASARLCSALFRRCDSINRSLAGRTNRSQQYSCAIANERDRISFIEQIRTELFSERSPRRRDRCCHYSVHYFCPTCAQTSPFFRSQLNKLSSHETTKTQMQLCLPLSLAHLFIAPSGPIWIYLSRRSGQVNLYPSVRS